MSIWLYYYIGYGKLVLFSDNKLILGYKEQLDLIIINNLRVPGIDYLYIDHTRVAKWHKSQGSSERSQEARRQFLNNSN